MGICYSHKFNSSKIENEFSNIHQQSYELFSLNGHNFIGTVIDVYDGDTVTVIFKCNLFKNNACYKWKCRLLRVDTPEIRTKNAEEKERGLFVRDKLRELILNQEVIIECGKFDKYGRLLVEIIIQENKKHINVSDWLLEHNYAYIYNGGTKTVFV